MKLLFDISELKQEMEATGISSQKIKNFFDGALGQLTDEQVNELEKINQDHFNFVTFTINSARERAKHLAL
jgi:hypothetical protein